MAVHEPRHRAPCAGRAGRRSRDRPARARVILDRARRPPTRRRACAPAVWRWIHCVTQRARPAWRRTGAWRSTACTAGRSLAQRLQHASLDAGARSPATSGSVSSTPTARAAPTAIGDCGRRRQPRGRGRRPAAHAHSARSVFSASLVEARGVRSRLAQQPRELVAPRQCSRAAHPRARVPAPLGDRLGQAWMPSRSSRSRRLRAARSTSIWQAAGLRPISRAYLGEAVVLDQAQMHGQLPGRRGSAAHRRGVSASRSASVSAVSCDPRRHGRGIGTSAGAAASRDRPPCSPPPGRAMPAPGGRASAAAAPPRTAATNTSPARSSASSREPRRAAR